LQHRILLMEPGETLVFRGGWHNQSDYATHGVVGAIIHVLERDRYNPSMFALTTCNSGSGWGTTLAGRPYESGIEFHESSSEYFPRPAARTAMRIKKIPKHRLHDEGFLALLLGQLALPRPENSARVLYDVLLPHLAGGTLDVAMAEAEREHGPLEEIFHRTRAHFLPMLSCLNYLLARDERGEPGLSAAQRAQVIAMPVVASHLLSSHTISRLVPSHPSHPAAGAAGDALRAAARAGRRARTDTRL
jgi:hypothetical protein